MAIIKCPECGHDVSNRANNCPNCGYVLEINPIDKNNPDINNTRTIRIQPELHRRKTLIELLLDKIGDMISSFFMWLFFIVMLIIIGIVIYNYPNILQIMQNIANG